MPGVTESFVRLDAMGRSLLVGTRCWSVCAPGGGRPAPAGIVRVRPTPMGSPLRMTKRWTATTGIHASTRIAALRPGHRSFLSRLAKASPHTKETFGVKCSPKAPV
ncbi:hypothetical protein SAV14893_028060 [Streptomyces avermitilis]|uniref:Uncharacterized protein n=1 Tax=Streptomyces avermitilis TaxID=33903 RepID=A0A4D4LYQ3_STRAX|nr:hypothetical protein SAV14893_028060 [Streptomyces avermitilis]